MSEAIDAIPDGFVIYDDADRLMICNEAYKQLYAASASAIRSGATFSDVVRYGIDNGQYPEAGTTEEEENAWFAEKIRRHRASSSSTSQQLSDGRWLQIRERRTLSGYIVGFRTDVTELKYETAKLRAVIDNFPGGISFIDANRRLAACNEHFRELLDLPEELFQNGMPTLEEIFRYNASRGEYGPGDPDEQVRTRLDLLRKSEPHVFERTRPNGTVLEVRGTPIQGGGFITSYTDITERHAAQAALSESERRARTQSETLKITLAHMSQGLSLFDAEDRLVAWNGRYVELYRIPPELAQRGTHFSALSAYLVQSSLLNDCEAFQLRPNAHSGTLQFRDGRKVNVVWKPTDGGGWVATHDDVTEYVRAQTELLQQRAELFHVNMRFEAALDNMSQGLCLFDADKTLVISNRRFREIYGLTEQQVAPGTSLRQVLQSHADNGEKSEKSIDAHVEQMPERLFEEFVLADGRVVAIRRKPLSDGAWVATHEDITEQRKLERERDSNREFLHQIIEHIPTHITVKDARDRRYVLINRAAESLLDSTEAGVLGKTAYDFFDKPLADEITGHDNEALQSQTGHLLSEHRIEDPRRGPRFITAKRIAIRDNYGDPAFLINVVDDVTERKLSNDRIAYLAHHDLLTGLANRTRFIEKLDAVVKRYARYETPFTVLLLDLDKFKSVNDTLGHPAGDQLLVEVGRRLKSSLRETDVLARLGGDEFAIIQEGETNQREGAIALALRIIDLICAPFDLGGNQVNIGTSIGIAVAPESGVDAESLLKKADLALYAAKAEGRNDYRLFQPAMAEASDAQKLLEGQLRDALQRDEFELHYQPIVGTENGAICCIEALIRWRHPTKGLVLPDEFIPLAESSGLMIPLGEWILQQACRSAASWPPHIKLAINISAAQFSNANLFDVVLCSLVESGLRPERLELEITETMLLRNEQECLLTIRQLRNLGIQIALDDFGVGYSSSSYFTRVPFDKIKIDKSFVQGFLEERECNAIIQSILALGRGLNMAIIAEGVERREQFEALRTAGVDFVQGYLFGGPEPLERLTLVPDQSQVKDVARGGAWRAASY